MNEKYELRIAHLEKMVAAQAQLTLILFPLLVGSNGTLRKGIAEALRCLLVSPAADLPPELRQQIVSMRDVLALPIPQAIVEASRQPSIRPVE